MFRTFLLLPMFCVPALALAQQPAPQEKPARELIAPEVRAAWEKAGARISGTERDKIWHMPRLFLKPDAPPPAIFFLSDPGGVSFATLPDPGIPFGISLGSVENAALNTLAKHKNLHMLFAPRQEWPSAKLKQLATLTQLRTLQIEAKERGKEVVAAVGRLKQLETLEINFASARPLPVPLTPLAGLKKLQHLQLSYMMHGPNVTRPLAGLTELRALKVMCQLTDADVKQLAGLKKLTTLDLGPSMKLTNESLKVVAGFEDLEWLTLRGAGITDAGLKHLAGHATLDTLRIGSTPITDAGLVHLKELPKLRRLDLSYTRVTDAGLETLAEVPNLEFVELYGLKLSAEAVNKLKKAHPRARVLSSVK